MNKKLEIEFTLEEKLRQITETIEKSEKNKKNKFVVDFPKLNLFSKVFLYISFDDINRLAITCKPLKSIIYSPYGLKMISKARIQDNLNFVKTSVLDKVNVIIKEIGNEENQQSEKDNSRNNKSDKNLQNEIESLKSLKSHLDEKIKLASRNLILSENAKNYLMVENSELKLQNAELNEVVMEHKETLKDLNKQYQNLLVAKQKEINDLTGKNEELKIHRKMLADEIVSLRDMLGRSEGEKVKFFNCLVSINKLVD